MRRLLDGPPNRQRCGAILACGALNAVLLALIAAVSSQREAMPPSALDRVLQTRVLRAGTTLDYAPFSLRCADGRAAGSDVEAARALAASLDAELQLVPTTWVTLLNDAAMGHFDLAVGGVTITLMRLRRVAFSRPLGVSSVKVLVAPCGSALLQLLAAGAGVATLDAAVADLPLVVNAGGTNEDFVRDFLPSARIVLLPQTAQFPALLAGSANLTITDAVEARLITLRHAGLLCASAGIVPSAAERKGFLLPRGDDVRWKAYVDAWLEPRQASYNVSVEAWLARTGAAEDSAQVACPAQ
jgi:cyclohexadienyl dehydratase